MAIAIATTTLPLEQAGPPDVRTCSFATKQQQQIAAVNVAVSPCEDFSQIKMILSMFDPGESKIQAYTDVGSNLNPHIKISIPAREEGKSGQGPEEKGSMFMQDKTLEDAVAFHQLPETTGDVFALILQSGGVLKACSSITDLDQGKQIHTYIVENGLESDLYVASTVINMYAKSGSLPDAHAVFDGLPKRNVVIWNTLISAYAQHTHYQEALQLFLQMQHESMEPNSITLVCLLKACSNTADLGLCHQIHFHIIESGFKCDLAVCNTLINMYAKCCSLENARAVFDGLMNRDVITWSVLISGYAQHGQGEEALQLFHQMREEGIKPDKVTFVWISQACSSIGVVMQCKWIHLCAIDSGFELDSYVGNGLIDMYAKCNSLEDASAVFDRLPRKDLITWSALIAGYAQHGYGQEALLLFQEMKEEGFMPSRVTFVSVLQACSSVAVLEQGQKIHSEVVEHGCDADIFVGNTLIDMYAKCGNLETARIVFERLPKQDVVTWTVLISGYTQCGDNHEALQLFQKMQQKGLEPDKFTFVSILQACSNTANLEQGRQIHAYMIESGFKLDILVENTLINMYAKCRSLDNALNTFNRLPQQDVVTWNTMIAAYGKHGHEQEALQVFQEMQKKAVQPDEVTFVSILQALCSIAVLDQGQKIHSNIIESGVELELFVANTLIDMYAKCGSLDNAHKVFNRLPKHDVVSWNALMTGCTHHGYEKEALQLFQQMQDGGMEPNEVTFVCILQVCSNIAALEQGKLIHNQIIESGVKLDFFLGNTLIDMYAKCGSLEDAESVFEEVPNRDVITWSALIAGYARHSKYVSALQRFDDMRQAGLKPDGVAYICLLSACSHVGLVDEGCLHFKFMREDGIAPSLEHYNALVDTIGRVGLLNEAEDLLETLPFQHNCVGWTSLLTSCRTYGDVDLGRRCFQQVVRLEGGSATGYVLMSNIYAHAGKWEDAKNVRELRISANAWKKPAKAFIEIDNQVHEFTVGDKTHPRADDIYAELKILSMRMREEGYMLALDLSLHSIPDENKEDALCGHCEKLAIAFGLISTPRGTTIRVAKNLRVCADCHKVAKLISKFEMREIIVKDIYCVHHFKDGACCCYD